jgi:hypothetical protein
MTNQNTTSEPADDVTPPAAAPQPARSRAPRALAITGIALGGVLGLGLTFAAGVGVGQLLPDHRGPASIEVRGPGGDRGGELQERIEQRMDERMGERDDRRDDRRELFEQWLEEQGIDPSTLPMPGGPTE